MQPQQSTRVDLGELKAQIAKKLGLDRSKRYFYNLNRFLSQKLSKSEFDKSCYRVFGRENIQLHNQLIRAILKNACQAKSLPPIHQVPAKGSPSKEDLNGPSGANQSINIWSNGVLPVSPKKGRSSIRDRKLRDRTSPLAPIGMEDNSSKGIMENGDYERQLQKPDKEMENCAMLQNQKSSGHISRSGLTAPLGIPFYTTNVGGGRKCNLETNKVESVSCYEWGSLTGSEMLQKRMQKIAAAQGLEGVSTESASALNNMLDLYLKRLIQSCVQLVGVRSTQFPKMESPHKQQVINGTWPSNEHIQATEEEKSGRSISLFDFKVAMELNPHQLGQDWPLLLEKICMQAYEE